MKIILSMFLMSSSLLLLGQKVPEQFPSQTYKLEFSEEGERAFNAHMSKCKALWKKENLTPEEKEYVYTCSEVDTYWGADNGGCSWYCGGGPKEVDASSYLSSQGSNEYLPSYAHDLNFKTVWAEGADGNGIGEYLIYFFAGQTPRITKLKIANGYVKSASAWRNNGRVKKLKMYIDDEPYAILNLDDSRSVQTFDIDTIGPWNPDMSLDDFPPVKGWAIKFEILEVYPGDKYQDVVISEIFFDGIDVHCLAAGTQIAMADGKEKPIEDVAVGDTVLTVLKNGALLPAIVEETASPFHNHLIKVEFTDSTSITCTHDHPLMSAEGVWVSHAPELTMSNYGMEFVSKLTIDSNIMSVDSIAKEISKLDDIYEHQQTYTIIRLSRGNRFIANGVVVATEPVPVK